MPTAYAVTWKRKPFPIPFLVDVDSRELAESMAVRLNYQGAYDVQVTTLEYEPDPEAAARIARRINERLGDEWAMQVKAG